MMAEASRDPKRSKAENNNENPNEITSFDNIIKKKTFKIIVVGDSGVGKTCLTFRFCSGRFPSESTDATIGVDFREKAVTVDKEEIRLQFWDTAGQERFRRSMVSHYYRNVNAVVFVYDVRSASSFDGLPHWLNECRIHGLVPEEIPMIVVGNKCDDDDNGSATKSTVVQTSVAQRFADDFGMPLFETSAKDDSKSDHVDAIFLTLAHKLKYSRPMFKENSNENKKKAIKILYKNEDYSQNSSSSPGYYYYCCS